MFIHEVPLPDTISGVWCAMSATRINGQIFFSEKINSQRCYFLYLLLPIITLFS